MASSADVLTLENLLVRAEGFDLAASPLQLAITRAADGRPIGDALDDDGIQRHFGCEREAIGCALPSLVVVIAGVRSGKSLIASAAAVKSALTADLSKLKTHELSRVAVVAPTIDNADATFRLLVGHVQASETLRALVVGKPTSDTIVLRRPQDGRTVEIVVVAASRGAVTLRSRWLAGFIFDEAALFGEEQAGAVVTAEELLRAGETRLVTGAQGWVISSPFGPEGVLWNLYQKHFGKPGRTLVVHAPTLAMNPAIDVSKVEEIRAKDPDTAAREYDATWLDASTSLLSAAAVDACTRKAPTVLGYEPGHKYVAAMDAGLRGNSWTLVVLTRKRGTDGQLRNVVALTRQWTGSKTTPLDPKVVLREIAGVLTTYRLKSVWADNHGTDFVRSIAHDCGITVIQVTTTAAEALERYTALALSVSTNAIEFAPDEVFRRDLLGLRKVARQGSVRIELPHTPDGRHGDYCPALVLALYKRPSAPTVSEPLTPEQEELARIDAALAVAAKKRRGGGFGGSGSSRAPWARPNIAPRLPGGFNR